MKKFTPSLFFLLWLWVPFALIAQESVPYSCAFSSQDQFNTYTTINNGNGSRSWSYSSSRAMYWGKGSAIDVWLISPAILFETGKTYKLTYNAWISTSGASNHKKLKVTVGQGATVASQTKVVFDETVSVNSNTNKYEVYFSVDTDAPYNIGFNCYGNVTTANDLYLNNIEVVEVAAVPSPVSDLQVIPDADENPLAQISWTNPSTSIAGVALSSLTKVELYRDTVLIYTDNAPVVGGQGSYTDNVTTAGKYTYKVIAYNSEGESTPVSLVSRWIGSTTKEIPYSCGFDTQDEFDEYTVINNSSGSRTWTYSTSSPKTLNYWGSDSNADKWVITPKLALDEVKTYKLSFKTWISNANSPRNLKITVGQGATIADQTLVIGDFVVDKTARNTYEFIFFVPQSGKWNIGINLYGETNSNDIYVDDIHLEEIVAVPLAITDLAVVPEESGLLTTQVSWTNPSADIAARTLTALSKVELYRDDVVIYTNNSPIVGASEVYTDTLPASGKYEYKVLAYSVNGAGEPMVVTSEWVGTKSVTLPYSSSFVEAQNDFDLYTIVDANDDGKTWKYSSSFGGIVHTDYAIPNDWFFTPYFKAVPGETYELAFSWKTYDGMHTENMDVTIGKSVDPADHTTIVNDDNERIYSSGLNKVKKIEFSIPVDVIDVLSEDYTIGFHLYSPDPWGMYIKDIQIKSLSTVSVIDETIDDKMFFNSSTHELYVTDAQSLSIYSISGKLVMSFSDVSGFVNIESLQSGVYIAKSVSKQGKSEIIKIAIK